MRFSNGFFFWEKWVEFITKLLLFFFFKFDESKLLLIFTT